jgi:hypothetical protein
MEWAKCPFEKAILSAQANCELSTRKVVAERMNAGCRSDLASQKCHVLLELLKERSRFAIKLTDTATERLPFGKLMKVMVGGLRGLEAVLHPERAGMASVTNVHALVNEAQNRYGNLESLPYQEIVRSVVTHQGRRRGER